MELAKIKVVRHPRFELGPSAWKADILAIILMPQFEKRTFYTILTYRNYLIWHENLNNERKF